MRLSRWQPLPDEAARRVYHGSSLRSGGAEQLVAANAKEKFPTPEGRPPDG